MRRAALYARVSPGGQTVEDQLGELRAIAQRRGWSVVEEFVDHGTYRAKKRDKRLAFERLRNAAIRGEVDVVTAWSVGRLSGSLHDLVDLLEQLRSYGVDVYLHEQAFDTATPSGKAVYETLELFAQFERQILSEVTKDGQARARAQGRVLGRPEPSPSLIEDMKALRAQGHSLRVIAGKLGVGRGTVEKYTKGVESPWK